ncbi:hypothetical protein HK103_006327 [Boothiomyces macroporosus]|uniref:Fumarylacetoacetase-like C-terminal domain-containing protein n=1 Tax=Boothiomyces macroporosus TaxID=261099 RepID=A0AAD5UDU2_9FUNG|nr:hypothetical protein HK103_006327 [Boothiomyces macroporosus]
MQNCRKIVAIGWNYSKHAKELNSNIPKEPLFFLKPPSSIIQQPENIEIPKGCLVHHEIELGIVIGKNGRNIKQSDADQYIDYIVLCLDMTARNLQNEAKEKGNPCFNRIIEHVSSIMKLEKGDLILTGTPEGVGQVVHGDELVGKLYNQSELLDTITFKAVNRPSE